MEECTAGWIKTSEGYIMFKNQDVRKEKADCKKEVIVNHHGVVLLKDQLGKKGCWFGFNRHFSICTLSGPYKDIQSGKGSKHISELVLRKARSLKEAVIMFKKQILKEEIPNSRSVIIANEEQAIVLEIKGKKIKSKNYPSKCFRTNIFLLLKEFNKFANQDYPKKRERSLARLRGIIKLTKKIKIGSQLKSPLGSHSERDLSSICRHDHSVTAGSVILEKKKNSFLIYYILNNSPCRGEYRFKRL